jgi:SAM-dependent methyltransferase
VSASGETLRPEHEGALDGLRCPSCTSELSVAADGFACPGCGRAYAAGAHPGVVRVAETTASFAEGFDAHLLDEVIPALEATAGTRSAEQILLDEAVRLGVYLGNPVLEGRADIARLLPVSRGVVLDVGCGLGTFTTAMARGARHVFALDRSPVRAALTAARTAAEGLHNVTAIQADGRKLPLADQSCDLVTVVGVMEWTGVGEADPLAAQRRLLAEVARVLRPGGVLLLGIENRFGAHYLAGSREEHLGLPFVSLLPRRLAGAYTRLVAHRRFDVLTHGRDALLGLAAEAGLSGRIAYPLPGYQNPQATFDDRDLRPGLALYARHVLRATTPARRLVAHALLHAPAGPLRRMLPAFWLVAGKAELPPPVPTTITGNGFASGAMKVVDVDAGVLERIGRRDGARTREPLVAGANGRAWINWPLTARRRRARARHLLRWAADEVLRDAAPATPSELDDARREAVDGIVFLRTRAAAAPGSMRSSATDVHALRIERIAPLDPVAGGWAEDRVAEVLAQAPVAVREHGDLVLTNLVVSDAGQVRTVDGPQGDAPRGPVGRDATLVLLDVLSSRRGHPAPDLAAALDVLTTLAGADAAAVEDLLARLDPSSDPVRLEGLLLVAVLRHCGTKGAVGGAERFVERAAAGELRTSIGGLRARARR